MVNASRKIAFPSSYMPMLVPMFMACVAPPWPVLGLGDIAKVEFLGFGPRTHNIVSVSVCLLKIKSIILHSSADEKCACA